MCTHFWVNAMSRTPVPTIPPVPVAKSQLPAGFADLVSALQSAVEHPIADNPANACVAMASATLKILPEARERIYQLSPESVVKLVQGAVLAAAVSCELPSGDFHEVALRELDLTLRVAQTRTVLVSDNFRFSVHHAAWEPLLRIGHLCRDGFSSPLVARTIYDHFGEDPYNPRITDRPEDEAVRVQRERIMHEVSKNPRKPNFTAADTEVWLRRVQAWARPRATATCG